MGKFDGFYRRSGDGIDLRGIRVMGKAVSPNRNLIPRRERNRQYELEPVFA